MHQRRHATLGREESRGLDGDGVEGAGGTDMRWKRKGGGRQRGEGWGVGGGWERLEVAREGGGGCSRMRVRFVLQGD